MASIGVRAALTAGGRVPRPLSKPRRARAVPKSTTASRAGTTAALTIRPAAPTGWALVGTLLRSQDPAETLQDCGGSGDCWYLSVLHGLRNVDLRWGEMGPFALLSL